MGGARWKLRASRRSRTGSEWQAGLQVWDRVSQASDTKAGGLLIRDLIFLSREGRDLGVASQAPPGSQASSRGEAKDSALLSSRDA